MQFRVRLLAIASFLGIMVGSLLLCGVQASTAASQQEPLPRIPPKEPVEALKAFRTLDGFRMDLLAHEPAVTDPVAMEYDENGLVYVVEMCDYPYTDKSTDKPNVERTTDLSLGRVRVLEDSDGDGKFDSSTIFAEELSWPTGIACWKGGVFVAATPDIWYLKDTDGDHRADVREKVYTGFRKFNVQAVMNNLKWGLDHQIYGAGGSNGGTIRTLAHPDAAPVSLSRNDFRFDPVTGRFEAISGGQRFGNTFDDWGNRFLCNIRNPAQHVVLPSQYLARNPYLAVSSPIHDAAEAGDQLPVYRASPPEAWRGVRARRWMAESGQNYPRSELAAEGFFTSSSGVTVYRGAAYPEKYRGNIFVCEVAGNLIHRLTVAPNGVTFAAKRADEKTEFVTSTDNWFRPVNFVNAPDGTLHVLDMYRETIEHPWSIPDDIKAQLDLESGRDRGRIYRLSPPGFRPPAPPRLGAATTDDLVACLENPNGWWRDTAHRLIFERQDKSAVAPLRGMLKTSKLPLARLHALWSLEGLGDLHDSDLVLALGDSAAGIREHAVRLAESRLHDSPTLRERLLGAAADPSPRVRFQVAFSIGEGGDPKLYEVLARIAKVDAGNEWIRTAILSSAADCPGKLFFQLAADRRFARTEPGRIMLRQLAQVAAASKRRDETERVWAALTTGPGHSPAELHPGVLLGLGDGFKSAGTNLVTAARAAGSDAERLVTRLMDEATTAAMDSSESVNDREQAIRLLSCGEFERSDGPLATLIDPRQPQAIQLAAVRALASFADPKVAPALLQRWRTLTPPVRIEAVEALLARKDRTLALLDAVESEIVARGDVSANRQAVLLKHPDDAIRSRAARLFDQNSVGSRSEVVTEYRSALALKVDRERGRRVLERECLTCHRLGDKGHDVGPNLVASLHHAPDQMLVHILDPSREVSPNYLEYIVALDDGRTVSGVVAAETATSITLRRAENVEETILRTNIAEIASTGKSLMPEGLEKKITVQEMADLIGFLLGKDQSP